MGTFTVRREVAAPVAEVWASLVHWPNHGRWVPLTRVVTTSASPAGVGASFVGRTGLGPLAFDDTMVVTAWQPPAGGHPGRCAIRKTGRVVLGDAMFTVTELGHDRCVVAWSESVEIAGVRRLPLASRANDRVGRWAFALVLARMAAETEASQRGVA